MGRRNWTRGRRIKTFLVWGGGEVGARWRRHLVPGAMASMGDVRHRGAADVEAHAPGRSGKVAGLLTASGMGSNTREAVSDWAKGGSDVHLVVPPPPKSPTWGQHSLHDF